MNMLTKDFTDAVERQFATLNDDVKAALKEAKTAQGIIFDLEQKMTRRDYGDGSPANETWGAMVANSTELKEFAEFSERKIRPGRVGFELKATITRADNSARSLERNAYLDDVVSIPRRRLRVRDLIPKVTISGGEFQYPKQTTRTLNAAPVAEGALKPESALGWEMKTGTPKVIAHWIPASRQALDDLKQLQGLIDGELLYGLALREDAQILAGDGTGENLPGLIPAATPYTAPFAITSGTMIDQIGLAILQCTLVDFMPSAIVMHPSDWMRICLLKDAAGGYIVGDPVKGSVVAMNGQGSSPMLFGLPVVTTTSIAIDKFLIGDFQAAATIYDRWLPRVEISTEHADFFTRNLVAILAEIRLGQAIKQAGALIHGDFGNVA